MKIGNVNISTYHAKQWTFAYEHSAVSNSSEWAPGATVPFLDKNKMGFSKFTVTLLVKGESREAIRADCSAILALLLEPVTLELDGFTHKFRAILQSHSETERSIRKYHLLQLVFDGYEFGDTVTATGTSSVSVTNPGNIASPAIITITPRIGAASIIIGGICRDPFTLSDLPVTIESVVNGKAIVLDGMTGLITENGVAKDAEIWALPSIMPGTHAVTCNNANMTIKVEVLPLYI